MFFMIWFSPSLILRTVLGRSDMVWESGKFFSWSAFGEKADQRIYLYTANTML